MSFTIEDPVEAAAMALLELRRQAPGAEVTWTVHEDGSLSALARDEASFAALTALLDCPDRWTSMSMRSARAMWRGVLVHVSTPVQLAVAL